MPPRKPKTPATPAPETHAHRECSDPPTVAHTSGATSYKINDNLWLVRYMVSVAPTAPAAPPPTHHVLWVDVSGSMYSDIPQIRRQLKNKLATMVGPDDLVTLGYFASPGECGVIFEAEHVRGLSDLTRLHRAIDKLSTLGCTCFVDPIRAMAEVVGRVRKSHPGHVTSGLFLSDGAHNSGGSIADVIRECDRAAGGFAIFATVGYGWYSGMPLLCQMAEHLGGTAIQAKDFNAWEPILASILGRKPMGAPRATVAVGDAIGGFVYAVQGSDLTTYTVNAGQASVPADLTEVWWLSPSQIGGSRGAVGPSIPNVAPTSAALSAAYAAVSLFARRVQAKVVKAILRALGDVRMAREYSVAFGKPKTAAYADVTALAASGAGRYVDGYDPNAVPRADAFTVLDLLALLEDTGCRFHPDHPAFVYNPIGRARNDATDVIDDDDLAGIVSGASGSVQAQLDAIKAAKGKPLKFVADPAPDGYLINGLVPAMDAPNVSMRILRTGHVDLSERIAKIVSDRDKAMATGDTATATALTADLDASGPVPAIFPTKTFRNYAVIADGIVNVEALPCSLTPAAWSVLARESVVTGSYRGDVQVLDLTKLPVMNEQMITSLSAKTTAVKALRLEAVKAALKVYKGFAAAWFPPASSKGLADEYGTTTAQWLRGQGLTDSGFSPKSVQAESKDTREIRLLDIAVGGMSKEPTLAEVLGKMDGTVKGKQSAFGVLMEGAVREVQQYTRGLGFTAGLNVLCMPRIDQADAVQKWIEAAMARLDEERKQLQRDLARVAFTVIVGPAWFTEFGEDMGDIPAKEADKGWVAWKTLDLGDDTVTIRLREKSIAI